jgi:F0F1-type ATP synthase membrane subunit c/vacuolar-type H+-ATPase subunit K
MNTEAFLLACGIAIGVAGAWVTMAQWLIGRTSLEAQGKNPELEPTFKKLTILGIALVESAAIYWLVMALLILYSDASLYKALASALAVAIPGLAAWFGEGKIVESAINAILRNPADEKKIQSNMILYIALTESAAIYGLIIWLLVLYS